MWQCFAKTSVPSGTLLSSFVQGSGLIRCTDIVYSGATCVSKPLTYKMNIQLLPANCIWQASAHMPYTSPNDFHSGKTQTHIIDHKLTLWTGRLCSRNLVKTGLKTWEQFWEHGNKGFVISTAFPNCIKVPHAHTPVSSRRQTINVNLKNCRLPRDD